MNVFPGALYVQSPKWGYPSRGDPRRVAPTILLVVHATYIDPTDTIVRSALEEVEAAAIDLDRDVSFTFCNDRDGSTVQALDPVTQVPWTNGILRSPDVSVSTIASMVGSALNPNEYCFMTVENVGNESLGRPITTHQVETMARQAAWGSLLTGLPVNADTVLGHRQFDSIEKGRCPTARSLSAIIDRVVFRANELLADEAQVAKFAS